MKAITIQLPESLARRLHEDNVSEQTVQAILIEALQWWLDARVARLLPAKRALPIEREGEATEEHEYFRRILVEMRGDTLSSDNELFADGLTRREYLALNEGEEKALWDKWFAQELDKTEGEAYCVRPDAVSAR